MSVVDSQHLYDLIDRAVSAVAGVETGANPAEQVATLQNTDKIAVWRAGAVIEAKFIEYGDLAAAFGSGIGTVTSVALSVPTGLSVSGSPITSSGTLAITLAANYAIPLSADTAAGVTAYGWGDHAGLYALVGHNHSGTYQPANATLDAVAAGTYAGDDSIVTVGTLAAGVVPWSLLSGVPLTFAPAAHALEAHSDVTITAKATGDILRWNGSAWVDYADSNYATAGHDHAGVYQPVGSYLTTLAMDGLSDVTITTQALGDLIYASANNAFVNLAGNTTATKKFLRQTGNGSISAAPAWDTVTASDVGLGSVENTALSTWAGSTSITTLGTISTGTIPWANLSGVPLTFAPAAHALEAHSDVTITAKAAGDLLRWNGSAWVDYADSAYAASSHAHASTDISLAKIGNPDFYTLQHMQDLVHSTGWVDGGAVTDGGSGTVNVASGHGLIKATDSSTAQLLFVKWAASTALALTDNDTNYVYVDYNAGSPVVTASTGDPTGDRRKILLARVYREGTTLHIFAGLRATIGDHAALMMRSMAETMPFAHVSGAMTEEAGTRNITVSAGVFWHGLTRIETDAVDTSGAGTFDAYYRNGVGGWTEVTGQTQINNTNYDDGDGTLGTLTANRYGVHWVYLSSASEVAVVYGQGDYLLAAAQDAAVPTPPESLATDSRLIAKIIIQKSAAAFTSIESAFMSTFQLAPISGADVSGPASSTDSELVRFNGTTGKIIKSGGAVNLGTEITLTSLAAYDVLYAASSSGLSRLAGNTTTTNKFLRSTGTGAAAQAPTWEAVTASDVGLGSVENTALSTWAGSTNLVTLGTVATGTWNATAIALGKGGTGAALVDPNADRILFWDDSAGAMTWLTLGTGLSITDTTINASASGGAWTHATTYTTLDNAGDNVGINAGASPSAKLHVIATTEILRLGYDASNYASFTVGSGGILAITGTSHVSVKGIYIATPGGVTSNVYVSPTAVPGGVGSANNVIIGRLAGYQLSSGSQNVLIGDASGQNITTHAQNTFIGANAGAASTGAGNIAIGYGALLSGGGGGTNIAIGYRCMEGGNAGSETIAIGYTAAFDATGSDYSIYLGSSAGRANTTGAAVSTGDYIICIGHQTYVTSATASHQMSIGNKDNRAIWSGDYRLGINIGGPANGQGLGIKSATALLSALSGATVTSTNLIPAGSTVLGVTIRVTTLITSGDGGTTFTIGDGTDADAWGTGIAFAANTVTTGTAFTVTTPTHYAAATSVVLTCTGGTFNAGAVRVTVHYLDYTAATS